MGFMENDAGRRGGFGPLAQGTILNEKNSIKTLKIFVFYVIIGTIREIGPKLGYILINRFLFMLEYHKKQWFSYILNHNCGKKLPWAAICGGETGEFWKIQTQKENRKRGKNTAREGVSKMTFCRLLVLAKERGSPRGAILPGKATRVWRRDFGRSPPEKIRPL